MDTSAAARTLPAAGVAEVTLGTRGLEKQAEGLPVAVAAGDRSASGVGVQVEVLEQATSQRVGISGFAFRLLGTGGAPIESPAPATVTLDYSAFRDLYGAGYADRLRVMALPECALTDPLPADCETSPKVLPTVNDRAGSRLEVQLANLAELQGTSPVAAPAAEVGAAPVAAPAPGSGVVLALTSGPEGEGGSFKATPFSASGDWQVGVGSGEFSWSWQMPVPAAPAGATPSIGTTYSSAAVDGFVTSKNTQASPMGLGWGSFANAFIERRYNTCRDDTVGTHYDNGDLCWASDNATISLNGQSSELVPTGSNDEWRLKADPRWKVQRLHITDPNLANGDNDGEYWKVTTPDGTQYWFGLGRDPAGTHWETNSTWWVPVIGDDSGEPCNVPGNMLFSQCQQAWRWNLDWVIDPNGNGQAFIYETEGMWYGAFNGLAGLEKFYLMGGQLKTVQWGRRDGVGPGQTTRVEFDLGWRCSTLDAEGTEPCGEPGTEGQTFPDVPMDLRCVQDAGGSIPPGCGGLISPTFFSARRYQGAATSVRAGGSFVPVDSFTFTHEFQDPDPTTPDDAKLWLSGIQRTGHDFVSGATVTLPAVNFGHTSLNNRHNPGADSPMPHWRVNQITDEFGGQINVVYGQPHLCNPPPMAGDPAQTAWDLNTTDCFPQKWAPDGSGEEPTFRMFNKYLVTQVEVKDTTGGSPSMVTNYFYGDEIVTKAGGAPQSWDPARDQVGAAWHRDNADPWVPEANLSWSDWRGYQDVLVTQGATRTRYKVHRGMDGDLLGQPNPGYRDIKISSLDGTVVNIDDDNWLSGRILDEFALRPDGSPESGTVHRYQAAVTANADPGNPSSDPILDARWVGENDTVQRLRTPATGVQFARTRTQQTYNGFLLFPERTIEHGWSDDSNDQRCSVTEYTFDASRWLLDYPARVARYPNATCDGDALTRSDIAYDNQPVGQMPSRGNPTTSRTQISGNSFTTGTWASTSMTYDILGRPLSVTDPNGNMTTTTYTPAAPGPDPEFPVAYPTQITVTNDAGHETTTSFEGLASGTPFARQMPASTTDANGNLTSFTYDPLGRLTEARQPTEATGPASWVFGYDIDPNKAQVPVIHTAQLQDTNGPSGTPRYLNTWVIYDSLLRERQTHLQSPTQSKTIVSATDYDNRGLAATSSLPEPVTGAPGQALLQAPAGGWTNRTQTTYDHLGRPSEVTDWFDDGDAGSEANNQYRKSVPIYSHNSVDSRWTTPGGSGVGTRARTTTDAYGRNIKVEEHDGTAWRPTTYTYDAADRLKTVTDPANNKITYTYDKAGRRTAMDDPDAGDWTYGYDLAGNQTTVTDALGSTTATVYDNQNRPTERHQGSTSGPLLAEWDYDASGHLGLLDRSIRHTTTGDWIVDITGYDARNRPTGRSWEIPASATGLTGTYSVSYGYDAADHQTSVTYPAVGGLPEETVTTTYNSIGLPEGLNGAQQYVFTAAYDERARPSLFGFGNASAGTMAKAWSYDTNQLLAGQITATSAGTIQDRKIKYDIVGNVTERDTNLNGGAFRECFGYDQRDRLISAYTTSPANTCASGAGKGTGAHSYWHDYTYTVDGSLKAKVESGSTTTTYTYPAGGANSTRPHAPTAVGSNTYTWNANGNEATRTIGGQTETFNWDAEHRLASINSPSGNSSYVYDVDGQRLLRTTPQGRTLYIDGHEITAPTSGPVTAVRSYGMSGQPVATRSTSSGVDFLAADNQGSVELTVGYGSSGTPEVVRTYLPYGKVRTGGQLPSDRAWIGQIEDDHAGLQYLNARYYDPTIGVFSSPDPLADQLRPKTFNPYQYGHNNPIRFADPTGLDPFCSANPEACKNGLKGPSRSSICSRDPEICRPHTTGPRPAPEIERTDSGLLVCVENCGPINFEVNRLYNSLDCDAGNPVRDFLLGSKCFGSEELQKALIEHAILEGLVETQQRLKGFQDLINQVMVGSAQFTLDQLSQSGQRPIKPGSNVTKAGQELQKHAEDGPFPKPTGNVEARNALGQAQLDDILTNPGSRVEPVTSGNFAGGARVITPDGRGATFDKFGNFQYFGVY